jgi:MFS family permease
MKQKVAILTAVFLLMALSNAVVPVLDAYADDPADQSLIYSGYFLGAMLTVLPAGIASDRYDRGRLIRIGVAGSCLSGIAMVLVPSPMVMALARVIEGIATGLFISSALSLVNSLQNHERMSGLFMASLNGGLLAGLIGTGAIAQYSGIHTSGLVLFTILSLPLIALLRNMHEVTASSKENPTARVIPVLRSFRWLFYATVVIFGAGGAVTGLYPGLSSESSGVLGFQIALQNIATIIAILAISNIPSDPIATVRIGGVMMASAVGLSYVTPFGFAFIGASAGIVQIGQLAFLGRSGEPQGVVIGIFTAASYGGMAFFPVAASMIADSVGYPAAFLLVALSALSVVLTIHRCSRCRISFR